MNDQIAIGVDIGGSHITSAAVDLGKLEILDNTTHSVEVDNKASKDIILKTWSKAINKTIQNLPDRNKVSIGFAIPGPFNYKNGIAMFEGNNDKYESLYKVSIPDELLQYLDCREADLRFLNDATSFAVGVSSQGKAKGLNKVIAVTLGTGFGSAFITNGVPQVNADDVPENGCLWDKPFKEGIGDDYFSTRWCVRRYREISSEQIKGVKEIAEANNQYSKTVFREFGANMAEFMIPFLRKFNANILVLGGNISNASEHFLPTLQKKIENEGLHIEYQVSTLMEDAAILGSAKLFNTVFWNQVKEDLPNI